MALLVESSLTKSLTDVVSFGNLPSASLRRRSSAALSKLGAEFFFLGLPAGCLGFLLLGPVGSKNVAVVVKAVLELIPFWGFWWTTPCSNLF